MSDIHPFRFRDKYLVLDVESDALLELDETAWQVLNLMEQGMERAAVAAALSSSCPPAEVAEALDEIERLKEAGLLWRRRQEPAGEAGEPVLKALCLFVTESCNLGCRYCFARHNGLSGEHMSREVGEAAIDFLLHSSPGRRHFEIDYFGGEPLLNLPLLEEITAYARRRAAASGKEIAFTVTTNGLLLDDAVTDFLVRENIAAVLSLDGRPAIQNSMRPLPGNGESYARTVNRLQRFTRRDPTGGYYLRGTYTSRNLDFVADVRHMYELGFRHLSMEPVVAPPAAAYALREEHLPRLEQEYENLVDYYLECLEAGDPFVFFHFAVDLEKGPCVYKRLTGCGAGSEYLAVTVDGSLYPCHQLTGRPELRLGNVLDSPTIRREPPATFTPPGPLLPRCRECWARYHCGGGCRAASYLNGAPGEPYFLECALQRKRLECALYLYARKVEQSGPDQPGLGRED